MNKTIQKERVLILRFNNKIKFSEIPLLRGGVNEALKEKSDILFHNHDGNGLRYSYPLIQYKIIKQQASLVCIKDGTEAIGLLLSHGLLNCRIGTRTECLEIESINANQHLIQTWDSSFSYYLRKWLPLNQENFATYQKIEGVIEKCQFLERILTGNILSMGKGLGIRFEQEITCKITELIDNKLMRYKNVKMMAFDIEFKSNVSLPDYIGLGKGASTGFGVLARKRENKEEIK